MAYVNLAFLPICLLVYFLIALRHPRHQAGHLLSLDTGQWLLAVPGAEQVALSLQHSWLGPGWVTLRFMRQTPLGSKEETLELTIWKTVVGANRWRELRIRLALAESPLQATLSPEQR